MKSRLYLLARSLSTSSGPPIRVGWTTNAGRGVFAVRDIAIGEVIHTAEPVVAHPTLPNMSKVCYYCLRRLGNVNHSFSSGGVAMGAYANHNVLTDYKTALASSLQVQFCSKKCAGYAEAFYAIEKRANWESFHKFCSEESLRSPLLAKRLICMIIRGMVSKDALDILAHSTVPTDAAKSWMFTKKLLLATLRDSGIPEEKLTFVSDEWYLGVLCRISLNTFRVELVVEDCTNLLAAAAASVAGEGISGSAVYILPSMYNHDCDPNVDIFWPENSLARLSARRNIASGEELRITYLDSSMSRSSRQQLLKEAYNFLCNCAKCTDD